ncbi:MAG: hypothetical protein PHO10_06730 [Gemmiger sp.]|nr:hypothetical protein [Gemmiger sp.]
MYEKELNEYWNQVEKHLACGKPQREELRRYIEKNVQDTLAEQPNISFAEMESLLGSPKDAAADFMETLPPDTAQEWEKQKHRRKRVTIAVVGVVAALLLGLVIYYYAIKGVAIVKTSTLVVSLEEGMPYPTLPPITE